MAIFLEYPKWLHSEGHASVLVQNPDAEAAQLAVWAEYKPVAPVPAPAPAIVPDAPPAAPQASPATPAPNLGDWDHDGHPGGSVPSDKPTNPLTQPQKRAGWPKGKPRNGRRG